MGASNIIVLVQHELLVFASFGFALAGLDDLIVDAIWVVRTLWRRTFVYTRHKRATVATLNPPTNSNRLVIFIPAWKEAAVIGATLQRATDVWDHPNYRIYVGCYGNDPDTIAAVRSVGDSRIRLVVGNVKGPTTKGDCLNQMWQSLLYDEEYDGQVSKAVILHDAEDIVHPDELTLFDSLIERFALVQLPVMPVIDPHSRWISGHYIDEFTESHGKAMVVREALGASVPSAGVGAAIARHILGSFAQLRRGQPFDPDSLTEDYELGLKICNAGLPCAFVRIADRDTGAIVAVKGQFPATLAASVRQKTRWTVGIALAGWDRMGWQGNLLEHWMRERDRRAILSALVMTAGYLAAILAFAVTAFHGSLVRMTQPLAILLGLNAALLIWRMVLRFGFVSASYGWREGLRAVPRMGISSVIAILSSTRAVHQYIRYLRSGKLTWDKTRHSILNEHA